MGGSPHDAAAPGTRIVSASGTKAASIPAAQDVLIHDPPKGVSELPQAISVDEGIHHRVGVGEDDGDVHQPEV